MPGGVGLLDSQWYDREQLAKIGQLGVIGESPLARVGQKDSPRCEVGDPCLERVRLHFPVAVAIDEVGRQVLRGGTHIAEKESVLGELGSLVRRWRRRQTQLVPNAVEGSQD